MGTQLVRLHKRIWARRVIASSMRLYGWTTAALSAPSIVRELGDIEYLYPLLVSSIS
jgi:hypothetical protein